MSTTTTKGKSTAAAAAAVADTRTSTIVVAASNSLDPTLAPAAYRCSGVNDEVEINNALTAAAAVNGSVILLEGDYNTVLTLSVAANVALKGVGWGAVINFNAGGNAVTVAGDNVKLRDFKVVIVAGAGGAGTRPNAVYATGRTNVEISKLWLHGDQTEADDGSDDRQNGILFGINMAYSKIVFCTIENFERNGMNLEGTNGNEVIHCEVEGNICYSNIQDGIRLEYALHCTVSGNTCNGNSGIGFAMSFSGDCTVSGNTCNENSGNGLQLPSSINCTVSGNTCNENGLHGLILSVTSDNNTVTGNMCYQNVRHGIFISSSDGNTVTGNTCNENDVNNTGTYDGISLSAATGNLIGMNTCKNNDRWGIMVDADSDFNKVSNNYTSGNTSGSIRVNNVNCDKNQIEFNTVEEGAPSDAGTATRSYGNYDPSVDAFVGDVGVAPF